MTVGIIGLGLIGGSLAKAFQRDESVTVLGWDADHSIVEFAEIAQAIDGELTDEKLQGLDLLLLATYPEAVVEHMTRLAPLLDKTTLEPLVVIDLDTVMPGLAVHDFGDAVRFAANTAAEDEADLSKVSLDLDLYRAFAEGFIGVTVDSLTQTEIDTMALGAVTITIELAVRFLDDYITGDKYFKVNYPGHNLIRARSQLALVQDMLRKYDDMKRIVQEVAQEHRMSVVEE